MSGAGQTGTLADLREVWPPASRHRSARRDRAAEAADQPKREPKRDAFGRFLRHRPAERARWRASGSSPARVRSR